MFSFPSKLYPITDRQISGLSHAEQVARLSAGGARLIQLREKQLAPREFHREAEEAIRVARSTGVQIIINDRVDIALALKADGVHLGQDDLPPEAARRMLGPDAVIGLSTHNAEQAQRAAALPIDYIAFGPICATQTKVNPDPVVGLNGLRRIRTLVGSIPLVAIGGITAENGVEVISSGADAVAVIGALLREATEIAESTRLLLSLL
jgi:thiamine-phosphate pyrophosphorylase